MSDSERNALSVRHSHSKTPTDGLFFLGVCVYVHENAQVLFLRAFYQQFEFPKHGVHQSTRESWHVLPMLQRKCPWYSPIMQTLLK